VVGEADPRARQVLTEMLADMGFEVASAAWGHELIELAQAAHPDLVIINTLLPDMDGFRAAAEVNRERETPVILVARRHKPEDLKRLVGDHILAYLVMPVGRSSLEATLPVAPGPLPAVPPGPAGGGRPAAGPGGPQGH
jgi:CheY-like chemotaxis protein